ncbi:MAG: AAA family ATPase [Reichenbachiella sp.]|uniref:AAA family ATPase n=1 Tax=Reichenbachiella sp. TaxID=2184521 RepID=UPI00329A3D1B
MKRITKIEFVNYKAFYDTGSDNKITIPDGKSVLLYGENGSGKSSIYEGLKQFISSSDSTADVAPSRHLAVAKTRDDNGTEVSNEVSVKVTFTDTAGSETKVFGVPTSNTQGVNYISKSNLLNGFLSYRELLRTYLMENPKDRKEFRLKFAQLLIEVILSKQINTVTQRTFQRSWEDLHIPRAWYKEDTLEKFNLGLNSEVQKINLLLPTILQYFESDFQTQIVVSKSEIEKYHSPRMDRWGKYPACEIDLEVSLFGANTDNDEENHLTVLNEARLSALAISIYLASLINTPQDNFDFKILFLDDIFIGLDMSNRLPLLEILKNFKKPIIEQFVDDQNDNAIVERVSVVGGIVQTEPEPFFKTYQIFISTYDRFWFSVARNFLETKSKEKWCFLELFANRKSTLSFNTPLLYSSLNYLQKAELYYKKHDHTSCANHLRKAIEQRLKDLLPSNRHYAEYPDHETGVTEIKKLRTLNQYLEKFISYCDEHGINASELEDLKNLKDWYFNPFSHDNIGTPIFKRELDLAKSLVYKLEDFQFNVLLEAGGKLLFRFDDGSGQTREYKIELQENLRWIKSVDGNLLLNAAIQCYEWTQNGKIRQVNWALNGTNPLRIISFYNNKLNHLLGQGDENKVPMSTFWSDLYQEENNQPLSSLIT